MKSVGSEAPRSASQNPGLSQGLCLCQYEPEALEHEPPDLGHITGKTAAVEEPGDFMAILSDSKREGHVGGGGRKEGRSINKNTSLSSKGWESLFWSQIWVTIA